MTRIIIRSSAIFLLAILLSCSKSKSINKEIDYIVYGTYCGECYGDCIRMFKLDGEKLILDTSDIFFQNADNLENATGKILKQNEFEQASKLVDKLPAIFLKSEDRKFGHPDESDQCGIYLQIKIGNNIKTSFIDTDTTSLPSELREYAELLMRNSKFKPF